MARPPGVQALTGRRPELLPGRVQDARSGSAIPPSTRVIFGWPDVTSPHLAGDWEAAFRYAELTGRRGIAALDWLAARAAEVRELLTDPEVQAEIDELSSELLWPVAGPPVV